jgi:HEAT repeat protein
MAMAAVLAVVVSAPLAHAFDWDGKVKKLAQGINDPEVVNRLDAIKRLAGVGAAQLVPILLPLLDDPQPRVRAEAGQALARAGASEAVLPIAHWLQSPLKEDRILGATLLGQLRSPRGVPWLARTLADGDVEVRSAAVQALGQIGGAEVIDPLIGALDDSSQVVRKAAVNVLRDLDDPRAVIPLVGRFSETDKEVRLAAVRAIGRLHDARATQAVLRLLDDPAPEVRLAAIETLGLLGSPTSLDALLPLLDGPSGAVLGAACQALGRIGSERAVQALVRQLGKNRAVDAAISGLATAGSLAVPPLLACLAKGGCDPARVVTLLGSLGDRSATPALIAELERGRISKVEIVVVALGNLADPRALGPLLARLPGASADLQLDILQAVLPIADGRAADPVAPLLASPVDGVRLAALELLGRPGVGSARFSRQVIKLLAAAQPVRLRLAAARALGTCGDADAVAPLVALLADDDRELAAAASDALADLARADAGPALLRAAQQGTVAVRALALHALRSVLLAAPLPGAAKVIAALARSGDGRLALPAIDDLGALPAAEAVPVLFALVKGELRDRRRAALAALAAYVSDPAVRAVLLTAAREGDDASRAVALWSLVGTDAPPLAELATAARGRGFALPITASAVLARRRLGDEALASQLAASSNPWVKVNAIVLLARAATPGARATLVRLAADPVSAVRIAAIRALVKLGGAEVEALRRRLADDDVDSRVRAAASQPAPTPSGEVWRPSWSDERGEPLGGEVVVAVGVDGIALSGITDSNGRMPVSAPAPVVYQCLGRPASDLLAAPLDRCTLER